MVLIVAGWAALYPFQNSSSMAYRVTRVLPLPVGSVDGELVLYSDYLASYRTSEYYVSKNNEVKLSGDAAETQLKYYKRQSLTLAEEVAYARKLAKQYDVTVSDDDVSEFIDKERTTVNGRVSQETYDASIRMLFGESVDDYRFRTASTMLKNRAAFAVDENAEKQSEAALSALKDGKSFAETVEIVNKMSGGEAATGQSGSVDVTGKFNGLRIDDFAQLEKGALSSILRTTTDGGYYIVKLEDRTDSKVSFTYIHIPLKTFSEQFEKLRTDGKINEYISVPEVEHL